MNDRDSAGKQLIDVSALELGWEVSIPWHADCKNELF